MILDLILYLTVLILLSPLIYFYKKSQFKIFVLGLVILSILSLIHFFTSISYNMEGFSLLTKKTLNDELIYHYTAIYLSEHLFSPSIQDAMQIQKSLVGYSSIKSIYFSYIFAIFYFLLAKNIIVAKAIITFFSAMVIVKLYDILRLFLNKKFSFFFSFCILFYPSFLIHSIQLEKDNFLLYLFLISIYSLLVLIFHKRLNYFKFVIITSMLFLLRPQYGLLLFLLLIFSHLLNSKYFSRKNTFVYVVLFFFILLPLPIIFLKSYYPEIFFFLDSLKNYSVFAGNVGFLKHDYSSYGSTFQTILFSMYYFLFSPLSTYVINANIFWKVMLIEPIFFFILPSIYVIKNSFYLKSSMDKKVLSFFVFTILFYTYLSVLFESHVSSYLRKRMIVYLSMYILSLYFFSKKQINTNLSKKKDRYLPN